MTTSATLARESVLAEVINCRAAWALVRQHQRHAEPQTNCDSQSVVVEVEAQRCDRRGT
jgi:hypothetical protein